MSINLLNYNKDEIKNILSDWGEPGYRSGQIFTAINKGVDISDITTLSKKLRERLCAEYDSYLPTIKEKFVSSIDGTVKYLFECIDGQLIESVLMRYKHGNSVCISSQAGCRMGCRFCASTIGGKARDLDPAEILGQVIAVGKDSGERISNIVLMGIGEPLDNYDNVIKFLKLVNDPDGLNIGYRHISLSTCGLCDKINKLANEGMPVTLSISLHASSDSDRSAIMPVNNLYGLDELMTTARNYFDKTGRRISFEYALIAGHNDDEVHARQLAGLIKKYFETTEGVHINLIPLNPVNERDLKGSEKKSVERFQRILTGSSLNATVRRKLGSDIDASCGQLRHRSTDQP